MRYFLSFSYNGLNYHGWQIQKNANSVQEVIEDALSNILRLKVKLTGAGRTDTGVHAKLMVAHFDAQISNELENNLLYLKGSIPGSKNCEVLVKKAVKDIKRQTIKEKILAAEQAKKTPDKKKK